MYLHNSILFFIGLCDIICITLFIINIVVEKIRKNKKSVTKFKNEKNKYKKILFIDKIYEKRAELAKYINIIILYVIVLTISAIYVDKTNENYNQKYSKYNNSNLKIAGTIVSDIEEKDYKYVCRIKVESVNKNKYFKRDFLLLNVKRSDDFDLNKIKYGNKIMITGEYIEPSRARNYKGFDYKQYLKTQKIYGTITVNNINNIKIIKENNVNIIDLVTNNIKDKMKENLKKILSKDTYALATGILIGYDNEINEEVIQAFKNSNLSHMLAISGAHTNYIILAINIIFAKKIIGTRKQKIIIIVFLIFFMKITGMTPSVVRAGVTCIIYMIASLTFRKADTANTISIVTLITLLENPFNLFNVGMQLSYAGSISIILFYNIFEEKINISNKIFKYIVENMLITISANIFIIPIMWYNFNTISLTFIFSNLCAGSILGLSIILDLIVTLLSFLSLKLTAIPAIILNILLKIIIKIAEFFGSLSISKITVTTPSLITIVIYYLTCIIFIFARRRLNKNRILKMLSLLIICILIFELNIFPPLNPKLQVHFIDVGQGDSTLIQTPTNKTILIDGGGSNFEGGFDVGNKVLIPYLLDRKIHKLDYVIISHFDSDHCQGILETMKTIRIGEIIISHQKKSSYNYREFIRIVKEKNIKVRFVVAGDNVKIENEISFYILWPTKEQIEENPLNNNSIVTKFCYMNFSMLFTGDIEEIAEKAILEKYPNKVNSKKKNEHNIFKASVIKVAHHGSKTSSTMDFLEAVKPEIALIGVGANNKFGHPSEETLKKLQNINCSIYRTDQYGEITIKTDGKRITTSIFSRFW